jgi:hypothetical protein
MKYLDNSNFLCKRKSRSKLLCREDVNIVKGDGDFFVMKGQVKSQVGRLTKWVPLAYVALWEGTFQVGSCVFSSWRKSACTVSSVLHGFHSSEDGLDHQLEIDAPPS